VLTFSVEKNQREVFGYWEKWERLGLEGKDLEKGGGGERFESPMGVEWLRKKVGRKDR